MVDGRSGLVDEYDDTEGQLEELVDSQHARLSRMDVRYGDPRKQEVMGGQKTALSFGQAMAKLHRQILKSEQFYNSFKSEYESDIERIKKYATDESLLSLWALRVKGWKDPGASGSQDIDNEELVETAEKFLLMKKKLREALGEALCSTMKERKGLSRKGAIRLKSAKRLKEKVVLAHSQVLALLDLVPNGHEHCEDLLSELGKLKVLIDPDDEKNKELYNGAYYEEGEGSNGENDGT
jgi:hypothetical protein